MHLDNNKANTFNLDDSLDWKSDYLIISTPMTNCKTVNLNVERDEGKAKAAQKKLYGDGPSKPVGQVPSDMPSNIVCDRKTFLTQPAVKSLLPHTKASQLLKYKPASLVQGRFEPSGLPMTRQRTPVEALLMHPGRLQEFQAPTIYVLQQQVGADSVRRLYKRKLELDIEYKKLKIKIAKLELEKLEHEKKQRFVPDESSCQSPLTGRRCSEVVSTLTPPAAKLGV
ncbi:mucin-3A-like isoform X2 [Scomber scombrus]|uniref:Mucin-3A-like isoform X2 n=1 Tax=Scomber scombrus TaxID=13677 RepID=A0AAV1PA84_SCOSC